MDKRLDDAQSDADAILSSLSALAIFTAQADRFAVSWVRLARADDAETKASGERLLAGTNAILKQTREAMDRTIQDFGDWFNGQDGTSEVMVRIGDPIYRIMEMRRLGISVANAEHSDFDAMNVNESDGG